MEEEEEKGVEVEKGEKVEEKVDQGTSAITGKMAHVREETLVVFSTTAPHRGGGTDNRSVQKFQQGRR